MFFGRVRRYLCGGRVYPLSPLCVAIGGDANWNSSFAQPHTLSQLTLVETRQEPLPLFSCPAPPS
jgi:hypothetical protein